VAVCLFPLKFGNPLTIYRNYVIETPDQGCQCFYEHLIGPVGVLAKTRPRSIFLGVLIYLLIPIRYRSQKDWTTPLWRNPDSRHCGASLGCRRRSVFLAVKLLVAPTWVISIWVGLAGQFLAHHRNFLPLAMGLIFYIWFALTDFTSTPSWDYVISGHPNSCCPDHLAQCFPL